MKSCFCFVAILIFSVLTGCAGISYDATSTSIGKNLLSGCYQTNTETAIYRMPPQIPTPGSKGTYLIQTGLPTNEWELTRYGRRWEKVIDIPVGSRLLVTRVFNQSWGSHGRHWLIYGRLVNSKLSTEELVIPSGNYALTGQLWITPTSPDHDSSQIRFHEYFVRPCHLAQ